MNAQTPYDRRVHPTCAKFTLPTRLFSLWTLPAG